MDIRAKKCGYFAVGGVGYLDGVPLRARVRAANPFGLPAAELLPSGSGSRALVGASLLLVNRREAVGLVGGAAVSVGEGQGD